MRELGLDLDDLRTARAQCDDPYANYKEAIVQLPDIAAYRAAVKSKLVHWVSELAYGPTTQPCAAGIIETTLAAF